MKTLSQRVAELKENENTAWKSYGNAVEREVNALLKRMGDDKGVTFDMIMREVGKLHDMESEDNFKEITSNLRFNVPMLTCYYVVNKYTYIRKLHDKYHRYLHELVEVEKTLK